MTISTSTNRADFTGNGVQTAFPFSFKAFSETDLALYKTDGTTQTLLSNPSHYTVSLNADQNVSPGGTITVTTAPLSSEALTLLRTVQSRQELDLITGGAFSPEAMETALDKLVMLIQQVEEVTGRSVAIPITSSETPDSFYANIVGVVTDAQAFANAAALSASQAAESAGLAGDNFVDTSTSTITIGTGSKNLTVSLNKSFRTGQFILISDSSDPTRYLAGQVSAYNRLTGAMTVNVLTSGGSGANGSWNVSLSGAKGETGAVGAVGPQGITWKGGWSGATAYSAYDAVQYNGVSYIAKAANTNQAPPNATYWDLLADKGTNGAGTGDMLGVSSAVDGEVVLFSGTGGKQTKRATGSGIVKLTSGALGLAVGGTDYAPATSGTNLLKGSGSGGFSNAVSGTDYAPATPAGTAILKANNLGGFSSAVAGTDYCPADNPNFATNAQIGGIDIGYRDVPQNTQSSNYTLALTDRGKQVYSVNSGAQNLTIPTNASVAFPIGATITLVNNGATAITIVSTGTTVYKAGTSAAWASGGTLAVRGMATLTKVATDTWFISGAGLS